MLNINLKELSKSKVFHFIGIDGIGMSSIAEVLFKNGFGVQGSNEVEGENMLALKDMGAKVFVGHKPENIDGADYIVFSSAVPEDNVEMVEAKKRGLPIIERAEMLQYVFTLKKSIAVSGTHGKTTTTSFVGTMLDVAGLDATIIDGGIMNRYNSNAKVGKGDFIVAEACEAFGNIKHYTTDIA
ncbi:MAG: UDP-N-acetylmuramate--L-alanine ligase, partial [Alphaproteobacteria bacterium]|nr:UDP-N-acetylmuramate--L-alanine ligase [Alphaproteobacteria bacterium]